MPDTPESPQNTPPPAGEGESPFASSDAAASELAALAKAVHDAMQQAEDAVAAAVQNTRQTLER